MAAGGGITVKIDGLDKLIKKLGEPRAEAPMNRFLDRGALVIQREGRSNAPVDTGRLRNSIAVEAPSNRSRKIGPGVDYGEYVETGTRPHWPPKGALAGWAKRHGLAEYPVRRAIGLRGTKAQPYMQPAADAGLTFIRGDVATLAAELEAAYQRG